MEKPGTPAVTPRPPAESHSGPSSKSGNGHPRMSVGGSRLIGAGLLAFVGLVIGLITGLQIGGNYVSDFEFEGARGYIATGNIGARVGAVIGGLNGAILGFLLARKKPAHRGHVEA